MKIDANKIDLTRRKLEVFAKLERKNTDEIGWIALAFSCSRKDAARLILKSRST